MGTRFLFVCLFGWSLISPITAASEPGYVLAVDEFRIYYDLQGEHALPEKHQIDVDENGIPDYIETIAIKLQLASAVFTDVFEYRHPLHSPRYRDTASHIDVVIKTRQGKGSAGDAVTRSRANWQGKDLGGALWIHLANDLSSDTLTPAHEVFHLFQNGYTFFKNRWFTEGSARWVEYAFKPGVGSDKPLPLSQAELDALFLQTYSAKSFWRRLARLSEPEKSIFPLSIENEVRPAENSPFPAEGDLHGITFMRTLLEQMDRQDDIAGERWKYSRLDWREVDQKSPRNNEDILCAVFNALDEFVPEENNSELSMFRDFIGAPGRLPCLHNIATP